jgi:hypothetical protein
MIAATALALTPTPDAVASSQPVRSAQFGDTGIGRSQRDDIPNR